MNRPSSTITAAALSGGLAALLFGLLSIFFPDQYQQVPAGMESGTAVLISSVVGYFKRERILDVRKSLS
jgi:hypothetical protein